MSIICRLFGHKPLTHDGYAGGVGYAKSAFETIDDIRRVHLHLTAICPRCKTNYHICNVHTPLERLR